MVICHYYEQGQGLPASLSVGQLAELRRVRRLRDYGVQGLRDLGERVAHAKDGKACERQCW